MKKQIIARQIKKWSSACLLSNAKHMLMIKPTKNGWVQEIVMEFDGLPNHIVADRLVALALESIDIHLQRNPEKMTTIMPFLAHALVSIVRRFSIELDEQSLSAFPKKERDFFLQEEELIKSVILS